MMEYATLSRKELYDFVWETPFLTLSKKYNLSDVGLRKVCVRMNIPFPKTGHWQKIRFGKKSPQLPLPEDSTVDQTIQLGLRDEQTKNIKGEVSPLKLLQADIEDSLSGYLVVPDRLTKPDSLIIALKKDLDSKKADTWNYIGMVSNSESVLNTNVHYKNVSRALRFWDTLIKALKIRGHDILFKYSHTTVIIEESDFRLFLREKSKKEVYRDGNWDRVRYIPTGIFSLQIDGYPQKEWKDGKDLLETQLSKIIAYLELDGRRLKEERTERQKREAERKEQERIKAEYLKSQEEDVSLFKKTLQKAKRWHEANNLRKYIAEVESRYTSTGNTDSDIEEWLIWAKAKADWFDPFVEKEDELLNGIDRDTLEAIKKQYSSSWFN